MLSIIYNFIVWDDEEINFIIDEQRNLYPIDRVHPTKAGYKEWWLPKFQECLYQMNMKS